MIKPAPRLAEIAAQFMRHDIEWSRGAYMIIDRRTANPIARLRPIPDTGRFELFYWSNVKGRWTTFGNLGRMKLMLEIPHQIVESDPMFRIPRPISLFRIGAPRPRAEKSVAGGELDAGEVEQRLVMRRPAPSPAPGRRKSFDCAPSYGLPATDRSGRPLAAAARCRIFPCSSQRPSRICTAAAGRETTARSRRLTLQAL
jgi:hypothetical protein